MPLHEKAGAMLGPYRVLDLTDEKGFYCGQLLGSLGADIIKVEPPGGDPSRRMGPFHHDQFHPERSLYWFAYNSNKRGITLNLATRDGAGILCKLVASADVVVESFAPGHLDSLGLGYAVLAHFNPRLVLTSISPFGQSGPYRDYQGPDLVCWAMGGLLAQTGDPDRPPVRISHIGFAYQIAGMDAAWATAMALYWRGLSGQGQHIDVSIQASVAKTTFMEHEVWEVTGKERERGSSFYKVPYSDVVLRTVWEAKDGFLYLMLRGGELGARENPKIVQWMDEEGMADDFIKGVDWSHLEWRACSGEEVDRIHGYFVRFFKSKTKAELAEGALKRDIILQSVCSPRDIVEHPQLKARAYWQDVAHPELGTHIAYPGRFCAPSASACKMWRRAPLIGEHNEEVYLKEIGLSRDELAALTEAGVV